MPAYEYSRSGDRRDVPVIFNMQGVPHVVKVVGDGVAIESASVNG